MNLQTHLSRQESDWAEALKVIRSALMSVTDLHGLRLDEVAEVSSITVSALLANDCALLKRSRPDKCEAFMARVAVNKAKDYTLARRRHQHRYFYLSNDDIEAAQSAS